MLTPTPAITRRRAGSAAAFSVAVAAAAFTLPSGGAGASAADTITLPAPFEVGQSATLQTEYSMDIDMLGQQIAITMTMDSAEEVVSVAADGSAVVHSTIEAVTIDDGGLGLSEDLGADMVGIEMSSEYDADGTPGDVEILNTAELDDSQRSVAEDLTEQTNAPFSFPTEPVAVGDTWTSVEELELTTGEIEVEYHYELTKLDADSFEIQVTYDQDLDVEVSDMRATGQVTGSGSITGDRSNPLAVGFTFEQLVELDAAGMSAQIEIIVSQTVVS